MSATWSHSSWTGSYTYVAPSSTLPPTTYTRALTAATPCVVLATGRSAALTHVVGGKYRRLSTMTAVDFKTLLRVRGEIFEELDKRLAGNEFVEICGSHSDYLWEVLHETS